MTDSDRRNARRSGGEVNRETSAARDQAATADQPERDSLYSRLPNVLKPPGLPSTDNAAKALEDLLNLVLGRNVTENEAVLSTKLRDRSLVLDQLYAKKRQNKARRRKGPTFMRLRLGALREEEQKYAVAVRLRELWIEYAREFLKVFSEDPNAITSAGHRPELDLHGAPLRITRSNDPSVTGVSGIVLIETANTLRIVSTDDRVRTILKQGSVAEVDLDGQKLELALSHFAHGRRRRKQRT
mmetsp:Transcript_5139/g.15373  ORF Transcript_5139/g.15373 Transcript_5139/m.15373 type:complete len:242 (+) Transcript_5139:134-859(+)